MTKDEALKLALEALEQLQGGCTDSNDGTVEAITVWCPEVIDAIREALALSVSSTQCEETSHAQPELTLDGLTPTEFALRELYEFQEATGCDTAAEFRAQPEQNQFNPDWDAMAVMVEEQQRMAKRIEELEAQRKPLSSVELVKIELSLRKYHDYDRYDLSLHDFARAIEAAHGIKE